MGELIYILLGLTSVVGLAFIVERGIMLRWNKVVPPEIGRSLAAFGLGAPKVPAPPVIAHHARTVWLLSIPVARTSLRTSPK